MIRVVSFHLDDVVYAIDAKQVIEILRPLPITPVPRARATIAGLINVRGQIIPAIDLRRRLGHSATGAAMNVLVRSADGPVCLLIDRVGDVLELDDKRVTPPPQTLRRDLRGVVTGSYPFPDRLMLVLDADRVTCAEDSGELS